MPRFFHYDLHIHSCLSPCGDEDMTPNNIVNMAVLKGLNIIAVSDHNFIKNALSVKQAAVKAGELLVVPACELQTREDIHVLCLFKTEKNALDFNEFLRGKTMIIPNNPDIFGHQIFMDENDNITGEIEYLLTVAADIGIYETAALVESFNGLAIPAHIDKDANGLYSILGGIDKDMGFKTVEIKGNAIEFIKKYPELKAYNIITNSDAHYLQDIAEAGDGNKLEMTELSVDALFSALTQKRF